MKTNLIVKLNFLVLGLGLTVYAIYQLNARGLGSSAMDALGIPKPSAQAKSSGDISWCDTRVAALIKPNAFKIAQEQNKWLIETDQKQELNFLSVERWFGANCAVKADQISKMSTEHKAVSDERFLPVLLIKFVTGEVDALRRSADGRYLWRDKAFRSQEMDKAIDSLQALSKTGATIAE